MTDVYELLLAITLEAAYAYSRGRTEGDDFRNENRRRLFLEDYQHDITRIAKWNEANRGREV